MRIRAVIAAIESFAPPSLQESWDNTGMQLGNPSEECSGVLICLDVNENIVEEAVERGCNLIVSHHPLIFKGLKQLTGKTSQERAVIAAIKNGIAVYSTHTALDSTEGGISYEMAKTLDLEVLRVLSPKKGIIKQFTAYVPSSLASDATLALLDSGFDNIMTAEKALESLETDEENPQDVPSWSINRESLTALSLNLPSWKLSDAMEAINGLAAGDEATISVSTTDNSTPNLGLGVVARTPLGKDITLSEFVETVKKRFSVKRLRISSGVSPDMPVKTVALCGGSGGEFISDAIRCGADVFISADIRYHDFSDFNSAICIIDIGHFESEICAKDILYRLITKKIPNFAVYKSELEKNPVNYL